jgi:alkanesulfonate monooxygenase SsuD/methylene tetrahydromethanopterin reductase-like flavin-dependent oxidoreductase (luciferase family)
MLTDHRFDLGIGTGNQWMNQAAVDEIGMPPTTPAQRLALIERTVQYLRELETTTRTPVMIAAGGRGARTLAGRLANIVTLAHNPLADHQHVKQMIADIAQTAGNRCEQIEYNMEVLVVGDSIPQRLIRLVGDDLHALTAADSLYLLRGIPQQMADQIQHRRDIFGYSYITVNELYLEQFAPVVELLHGV